MCLSVHLSLSSPLANEMNRRRQVGGLSVRQSENCAIALLLSAELPQSANRFTWSVPWTVRSTHTWDKCLSLSLVRRSVLRSWWGMLRTTLYRSGHVSRRKPEETFQCRVSRDCVAVLPSSSSSSSASFPLSSLSSLSRDSDGTASLRHEMRVSIVPSDSTRSPEDQLGELGQVPNEAERPDWCLGEIRFRKRSTPLLAASN